VVKAKELGSSFSSEAAIVHTIDIYFLFTFEAIVNYRQL
jgi:hypothetical protein